MALKIVTGQRLRIHSILIIGSVLLGLLILPAQAQGSVVDLDLGSEGAVSWKINNIKPGDSGIETIELRNKGDRDGFVTIWISDINETDYGSDGASLDDYLLIKLSGERMETNLSLPSTIHEFPQNATGPKYINITRLNRGEVIKLDWEWEFQMLQAPQNEAQGDQLSFNIHFVLEEFPSSGDGYRSHDDDETVVKIITPDEPLKATNSGKTVSNETIYENIAEDVEINDKGKKESYNLLWILYLILMGLITLAGKKILQQ